MDITTRVWLNILLITSLIYYITAEECPSTSCRASNSSYVQQLNLQNPGPFFYVAGLFSVHQADSSTKCGDINPLGFQRAMAFLWAIRTYQDRYPSTPQDGDIRALVLDTCSEGSKLVQQFLNLQECQVVYGDPIVQPSSISAFIGADSSDQASMLAPFFDNSEETLISTSRFVKTNEQPPSSVPNVLFTSPPLTDDATAIVAILNNLDYKYVQVVYNKYNIGVSTKDSFTDLAKEFGVCAVTSLAVEDYLNTDQVVDALSNQQQTGVVVLLTNHQSTKDILLSAKTRNIQDNFLWLGTSTWRENFQLLSSLENVPNGSIAIEAKVNDGVVDNFISDFISSGQISTSHWTSKYFRDTANQGIFSRAIISNTIQAVDSVLYGIFKAFGLVCNTGVSFCDNFKNDPNAKSLIREQILNNDVIVRYNASTGQAVNTEYTIYQFRQGDYHKVGTYNQEGQSVQWTDSDVAANIPNISSHCPTESCPQCNQETSNSAVDTPPTNTLLERRDGVWVIILIVLASVGILTVIIFETYILFKTLGDRFVLRWKAMWLGQLLLLGIFLSYLTMFAFVPSPRSSTCGIIRFGVGSSYAMIFAVLLVKLMIVLSSKRVGRLEGTFQFFMFLFAWGVQLAVDIQWLVLENPDVRYTGEIWLCRVTFLNHVKSLSYVMFLIAACTILAIKAHGTLTNYRESVFIGLAAGCSIPVWVVWIILGHLHEDNPEYHDPCLAFGLFVTATLVLLLMFIPKIRQLSRLQKDMMYAEDELDVAASVHSLPAGSILTSHDGHPVILEPVHSSLGSYPVTDVDDVIISEANGDTHKRRHHPNGNPRALKLIHPGSSADSVYSVHSVPSSYHYRRRHHHSPVYATTTRLGPSRSHPNYHDTQRTQSELNYNIHYNTASTKNHGYPSNVRKAKSVHEMELW